MSLELGNVMLAFGRFKKGKSWDGMRLCECPLMELDAYLGYLESLEDPHPVVVEGIEKIRAFLEQDHIRALLEQILEEN